MAVVGYFTVQNIDRLPLGLLWRKVRNIAGISYLEYKSYFDGLTKGVGIFIKDIVQFDRQISLAEMRQVLPDFHPPQGFRYLDNKTFELLRSFYLARSYLHRIAA